MAYTAVPTTDKDLAVYIPPLKPPLAILEPSNKLELEEYAAEVYEWLSLVRLGSPRVAVGDKIDPYLSTYAVPDGLDNDSDGTQEGRLCRLSWEGFLPSTWTRELLAEVILAVPSRSWFSLSATSFARSVVGDHAECTILRPPGSSGEYFLWDIKNHA